MPRSEERGDRMETIEDKLGRATNYLHDIKVHTPLPHPAARISNNLKQYDSLFL